MSIISVVVGVVLIVIVLWDALETIILPRRVTSLFGLTQVFYRSTWQPWSAIGRRIKSTRRRDNYLWLFGPLSVLLLLGVWAVGLVVGFGLLRNAAESNQPGSLWHYFYMSATTFFTLGIGSVEPNTPVGQFLTIAEGATGFSFLGIVIGYLPTFYGSFSRREVNISLLDARAGSPPSALELLRRHRQNGQFINLEPFFADWERWSAELLESHLSYPMLGYFRSQHENESWLAALTMVLDASALAANVCDGPAAHRANLTFAIARHAAVDLCQVYLTKPIILSDDRRLTAALTQLPGILGNKATLSEDKLTKMRALYEPYVNALSRHFLMPLPAWTPVSNAQYNWQTTAWDQIDGAMAKP